MIVCAMGFWLYIHIHLLKLGILCSLPKYDDSKTSVFVKKYVCACNVSFKAILHLS